MSRLGGTKAASTVLAAPRPAGLRWRGNRQHVAVVGAPGRRVGDRRVDQPTAYDEVKTHILGPGAILRSKTPELVRQEVHGLMLAHYAVRRLIHEAARKVDEVPDRLSFIHAVRVVRRRVENPGISPLGSP